MLTGAGGAGEDGETVNDVNDDNLDVGLALDRVEGIELKDVLTLSQSVNQKQNQNIWLTLSGVEKSQKGTEGCASAGGACASSPSAASPTAKSTKKRSTKKKKEKEKIVEDV